MERFGRLFGSETKEIRQNCVLAPVLIPGMLDSFGIRSLSKGLVYASGQSDELTFIKTPPGALFVGDAVLQLRDTSCRNIYFLGSCGLINRNLGLDIGSVVVPQSAYPMESFSYLLAGQRHEVGLAYPDADLLQKVDSLNQQIARVKCVSFGSLELEEAYLTTLIGLGADVVEMECAALFNAARHINRHAVAILYISDIVGAQWFWQSFSSEDKKSLTEAVSQACLLIKDLSSGNK